MNELKLAILAGADSKKFLVDFTEQIDRLEKLTGALGKLGKVSTKAVVEEDEVEENETDEIEVEEDDDFAAKPAKVKPVKKVDFDEEEETETEEVEVDETEDDVEEVMPPAKKTKAKKVTVDDVNDACKARAASVGGKEGRAEVLAILKKKFKTESVSALKPEQYGACIAAMAVDQ